MGNYCTAEKEALNTLQQGGNNAMSAAIDKPNLFEQREVCYIIVLAVGVTLLFQACWKICWKKLEARRQQVQQVNIV